MNTATSNMYRGLQETKVQTLKKLCIITKYIKITVVILYAHLSGYTAYLTGIKKLLE